MKIVCQNCSAKYSIADDKVQGKKVFKIKCKKCNEDILVRGSEAGAEGDAAGASQNDSSFSEDEATRVASPSTLGGGGDEPTWHAVVGGEQSGPFSIAQLKEMVAGGQIDAETFVWKEGFGDWKPLKEVGDLSAVLEGATPPASGGDPGFGGGGLFGDSKGKPAEAKARAGSKAAGGGDLFGSGGSSSKMFGEEEVSTSASASASRAEPKKEDSSEKLTGQRNENSVLFSLATLQQVAGASGPEPSKPAEKKAAAADASGLIDIKNMAASLGPSLGGGDKKKGVDDILTVGTGGGLASPLAAPVLAPVATPVAAEPEKAAPQGGSKTTLIAIIAVAVILVGGGLGAVFILKPAPQQPSASPGATVIREVRTEVVREVAGSAAAAASAAPSATAAGSDHGGGDRPSGGDRPRPRPASGDRPAASAQASAAPAPTAAARPAAGGCAARCAGNIDCLLRCSTEPPAGAAPRASAAPAADLPEQPARNDVSSAMRGVSSAVNACASGQTGVATVQITFASSGRVTTANVQPPFAGTPAGSCIAREVRSATVPPFSRPTFSVTYPFVIR